MNASTPRHPADSASAAVHAVGLHQSFSGRKGPVRAVAGIDLEIRPGEIIGLLGPNGAGKSTLIDLLLGLVHPDQGTVEVFGQSPRRAVEQGRIGAVLQTGGLLQDLTVAQTVRMIAATHRQPLPVAEAMDQAGLTELAELAERRVSKCSGGEQQRLRFALALLPRPDLLVLDEPTSGMDPVSRQRFWETMRSQARTGRTVIFATHYLEEAEHFAQRIVLVSGGKMVADGPTEQIRERAASRTVSAELPEDFDLAALPGVLHAERRGNSMALHTSDADALARHLLTRTPARNLSIEQASLDEAFAALTSTTEQD